MNHTGTKTIVTSRLRLRPFTLEDAKPMFRNWAGDSEVTRFLTWPPHKGPEESREILAKWAEAYADARTYNWCIALRDTDEAIGSLSCVHLNEEVGSAEVGYCIGRAYWRQGYTSEALGAVIEYLFREVGVNRVEARHDVNNPNSGKVMRKCGMEYEGTRRKADKNNTGICDTCYYGILNPHSI